MSSTNNLGLKFHTKNKLLIYNKSESGPNIDSFGTPQVTGVKFDVDLATEVN